MPPLAALRVPVWEAVRLPGCKATLPGPAEIVPLLLLNFKPGSMVRLYPLLEPRFNFMPDDELTVLLPARLIVPLETETVPVGSAAAMIESLVPARVRALPAADRLKVVGVVEVAARARTSVPLLRVIGALPSGPVAGPGDA